MLDRTDCDRRLATHARHIARVNERAWMRPVNVRPACIELRTRVGTLLIAFGTRLAPAARHPSAAPFVSGQYHV